MNSFKRNDGGFTGLEAAIVLIAFVVVAAVFSYVVLGAGFFTSQKAQETVYKGVQQATTNILLKGSVYGTASTAAGIDGINLTIGLAPGAPTIDISKMKIVYSNATVTPIIMDMGTGTTPTLGSTFNSTKDNMGGEDQINIWFAIPPAPKNTVMNIEIRPGGGGAAIPFSKTVPPTVNPVNVLP
jgi:flagellin FlaB